MGNKLLLVLSLVAGAVCLPNAQQPLLDSIVHVDRYHVSSRDHAKAIMDRAAALNADIWAVTPSYIDIQRPAGHPLLPSFNHTTITHTLPQPSPSSSLSGCSSTEDLSLLSGTTFHSEYHRTCEIIDFANQLAKQFPKQVELVRLGISSQEQEVLAMRVGRDASRKAKPRIVILGAQHARDWIATSSALYVAHALVVSSNQDYSLTNLLDNFDFTIIPVPNPDGYDYTWNEDRLWYKNRTPIKDEEGNEECVGIDMNRNWGYQWSPSPDPCHHWYGGSKPFEAPEVHAIASYIERTPEIRAVIELRSYGQMIMYPFAHSCEHIPAAAEDLIEAALGASKALAKVHGGTYMTGSACDLLYSAPGSVIDWAYTTGEVTYSYSVSLRDTGTYGFLLPPKYIRPVGEETGGLITYLTDWAWRHHKKW